MTSPTGKLDRKDPGDVTVRKFSYQFSYGVILCVASLRGAKKYTSIWCEQRDDLLCELESGKFDAYQVKTRKAENGEWQLNHEEFVGTITRFVNFDKEFPNCFEKFYFVSNACCLDSHSKQKKRKSPVRLLKAIYSGELDEGGKAAFEELRRKVGCSEEELLKTLRKTFTIKGPSEGEIEDAICASHVTSLNDCKHLSISTIKKISNALHSAVYDASRLITDDPDRHIISVLDNATSDPFLLAKRIRTTEVQQIISNVIKEVDAILTTGFSRALVDKEIDKKLDVIIKARFIGEFDRIEHAKSLAHNVLFGPLMSGGESKRSEALAWCARIMFGSKYVNEGNDFLKESDKLSSSLILDVTKAFGVYANGDKIKAIKIVSSIDAKQSMTAILIIHALSNGKSIAIDWFHRAKLSIADFDSDGKLLILEYLLHLKGWDEAIRLSEEVDDLDFENAPVLYTVVGIIQLIDTVHDDLKGMLLSLQLPWEASRFALSSTPEDVEKRRIARLNLIKACSFAKECNCIQAANSLSRFALWIELRDPRTTSRGVSRLEDMLRRSDHDLGLIHLAVQFNINIDVSLAEDEIEKQTALHGEANSSSALARLALVTLKPTPNDGIEYLCKNEKELLEHLNPVVVHMFGIQLSLAANRATQARDRLQVLLDSDISEDDRRRAVKLFEEYESDDPTQLKKVQFEKTDFVGDLAVYVDELHRNQRWGELCLYARVLFSRTRSQQDAELFLNALYEMGEFVEILEVLELRKDLASVSENILYMYCWALLRRGLVLESMQRLDEESIDKNNTNYRVLRVQQYLYSGKLDDLSAYVSKLLLNTSILSAEEVLQLAGIGISLNVIGVKKALIDSVSRESDDPAFLVNAYVIATRAGWEKEEEVSNWLGLAFQLSGEDGPVKTLPLSDVFEKQTEWNRNTSNIWSKIKRCEIPLSVAEGPLNSSLSWLFLFPALHNRKLTDPRKRSVISAFSGARNSENRCFGPRLGMDPTSILLLSLLGHLDKTVNKFDEIVIPQSTLAWLFRERVSAKVHQPSRVKDARSIFNLLAKGQLFKLAPSQNPNPDLVKNAGYELAEVLTEAKACSNKQKQHLVVQPGPVNRQGSLLNEELDLTEYKDCVIGCIDLVNFLFESGKIDQDKYEQCLAYLKLHEIPWPDPPSISSGCVLYLDYLSVSSFTHLEILDQLAGFGFTPIITKSTFDDTKQQDSYENLSDEAVSVIDKAIAILSKGLEEGKIVLGANHALGNDSESTIRDHPTFGLFSISPDCDQILVDDRCFNKNGHIGHKGGKTSIVTTIDLLDLLRREKEITLNDYYRSRTELRSFGYSFIPLNKRELKRHLKKSRMVNGQLIESIDVKAYREYILNIRMSDWLQIPLEYHWLDRFTSEVTEALVEQWNSRNSTEKASKVSSWLFGLIDIKEWAHVYYIKNNETILNAKRAWTIQLIIIQSNKIKQKYKQAFWCWFEDAVLGPIRENEAKFYEWLIDTVKEFITRMSMASIKRELKKELVGVSSSYLMNYSVDLLPPQIRLEILEDKSLVQKIGLEVNTTCTFRDQNVSFDRSALYHAYRESFKRDEAFRLKDVNQIEWSIVFEKEPTTDYFPKLESEKSTILAEGCAALLDDRKVRVEGVKRLAKKYEIPSDSLDFWLKIVSKQALSDDEYDLFCDDVKDTPNGWREKIAAELEKPKISIASLVPDSVRYYGRLVPVYDNSKFIDDFAKKNAQLFFDRLIEQNPRTAILNFLHLSSHESFTSSLSIEKLDEALLMDAIESLLKDGSVISQIGAVELGLRLGNKDPKIVPKLIVLAKELQDLEREPSRVVLYSAIFKSVYHEIAKKKVLDECPPFYRRLCALAHSSLLHRLIRQSRISPEDFSSWAVGVSQNYFTFQVLCDLRYEPRWIPAYANADQLRSESIGRIKTYVTKHIKNIQSETLRHFIYENESDCLIQDPGDLALYYPGPLEGALRNLNEQPIELRNVINCQLSGEPSSIDSFTALLNASPLFKVENQQADKAVELLQAADKETFKIEDRDKLAAALLLLALISATMRNGELASAVLSCTKKFRAFNAGFVSIHECITIGMLTSSCLSDACEWGESIADWITELSFSNLTRNESLELYDSIRTLRDIAPELQPFTSKAFSALGAFLSTEN